MVLAGGPSFLTDQLLNHADNATFVADLIGPGPVVANGMVFVNSGYGGFGGRAGNVLLAFGVE